MLAAICDDNSADRNSIYNMCKSYAFDTGLDMDIVTFENAEEFLKYEDFLSVDIAFLDIIMNDRPAGIEIAKQLRALHWDGAIIFTTSSGDYYPEGFETNAVHYLIKPISFEDFKSAMKRAESQVKIVMRTINIPSGKKILKTREKDIRYIEVFGRNAIVHTIDGEINTSLPLKTFESTLNDEIFLKCFRSIIVNMEYISQIEDDSFILDDGSKVPLTLRNRDALCNHYLEYQFSRIR